MSRIGGQLGINPETIGHWVNQAQIDEGHRPGTSTANAQREAQLERVNEGLHRACVVGASTAAGVPEG